MSVKLLKEINIDGTDGFLWSGSMGDYFSVITKNGDDSYYWTSVKVYPVSEWYSASDGSKTGWSFTDKDSNCGGSTESISDAEIKMEFTVSARGCWDSRVYVDGEYWDSEFHDMADLHSILENQVKEMMKQEMDLGDIDNY